MYVIFKDHTSVILTDRGNFSSSSIFLDWSDENLDQVLLSLTNNEGNSFLLRGNDKERMWQVFRDRFEVIEAAGGIVQNTENEMLFIYRHDKWDLPKGKIDPGESRQEAALREVREECGFSKLELGRQLQNTYHIYEHKERLILKVTYWYVMYSDERSLTPQVEEGITELSWKSRSNMDDVFKNTYPNIELLIRSFQ